ncbi:MAG: response regulator [Thermodesulfobacteriota bacterium]
MPDRWKVLLVDDEEDFAAALAERLRLRGIVVDTAFDGETALQKLVAYNPEVVVLDVMMPGIGGLAVLQHIKAQKPETQVILLTGKGSTRDGIEGMRLGAYDYLVKPVQIDELIGKLKEAAGASEAATSSMTKE